MIRDATPEDEPVLRRLDLATWSSLSSPVPAPPDDRPFEIDGVLVSELQEGIAGYVKLGAALPIEATDHVLEIKGLTVDPAHRRRGLGRALLHAALERAREAGARKVLLRVLAHNADARRLYAACGFEVEGVLREFFLIDGRYVDDVFMAYALTGDGS